MPPSGPTMIITVPEEGSSTWASDCPASSCSTSASSTPPSRWSSCLLLTGLAHRGDGQPTRLLGGLPHGRPPAGQSLLTPVGRPAHDRPRRRPGHDLVDAHLGEHLDGQLRAVALGQGLDGHQVPAPGRRLPVVGHLDDEPGLGGRHHPTLDPPPATVAQQHHLPGSDPSDHGGVTTLGAGRARPGCQAAVADRRAGRAGTAGTSPALRHEPLSEPTTPITNSTTPNAASR